MYVYYDIIELDYVYGWLIWLEKCVNVSVNVDINGIFN